PATGVDYRTKSGTLTFTPNVRTGLTPVEATIAVTVYPRAASDSVADLQVGLSAPTGGYATNRATATGLIVSKTSSVIGVAIAPSESIPLTTSGAMHLSVPVTLSASRTTALMLTYTVTPGSATYSKRATGGDYGGVTSGTIN